MDDSGNAQSRDPRQDDSSSNRVGYPQAGRYAPAEGQSGAYGFSEGSGTQYGQANMPGAAQNQPGYDTRNGAWSGGQYDSGMNGYDTQYQNQAYSQNSNGYQYNQQYGWAAQASPAYDAAGNPYFYSKKSKLAAGLLGIFLGGFGIHNFYLGYTNKAVIQLLLTVLGGLLTFGIASLASGIWGFVEGILILCSQYGSPWHRDGKGMELQD